MDLVVDDRDQQILAALGVGELVDQRAGGGRHGCWSDGITGAAGERGPLWYEPFVYRGSAMPHVGCVWVEPPRQRLR